MAKYMMYLRWGEIEEHMKKSSFNAPSDKAAIKTCSDILHWEYNEHPEWDEGDIGIELRKMNPKTRRYKGVCLIYKANGRLKVIPRSVD